jgi:hypothetical protein
VAYGQQVEFQGPIVQNVAYTNGSETVNITYTAVSDLDLRNSDYFEVYSFSAFCYLNNLMSYFQVCCHGKQCLDDYIWIPSTITNKNGLTITITINSTCIGKPLYGIRYLWHETPCLFKQAAIYSATDPNLPSPPYLKVF